MKLIDLAKVVRSKNAGPLKLTFDVMFETEGDYQRFVQSPALSAGGIAALYGVAEQTVEVLPYPVALAVKIVMDRKVPAGSPGDWDVYGAQQHAPLLEAEW